MDKLYIVGCGAAAGAVTLKGAEALDGCAAVVLHTEKIELFSELSKNGRFLPVTIAMSRRRILTGLTALYGKSYAPLRAVCALR